MPLDSLPNLVDQANINEIVLPVHWNVLSMGHFDDSVIDIEPYWQLQRLLKNAELNL